MPFVSYKKYGSSLLGVDGQRIAVVGCSAGAYLALVSGLFPETERPKAIVSFYGYGDIGADWYARPSEFYLKSAVVTEERARGCVGNQTISEDPGEKRFDFYVYCRQTGCWIEQVVGRDSCTGSTDIRDLSPIYHVTKSYPPTLLLHGTSDDDVPYCQSATMANAMKAARVEYKLITMYDLWHVTDEDSNNPAVKRALGDVLNFLAENLKW